MNRQRETWQKLLAIHQHTNWPERTEHPARKED